MKAIHRRRLLKLADFLEQLSPKVFDLHSIVDADYCENEPSSRYEWLQTMKNAAKETRLCGATACAIGYLPVLFPRSFRYNRRGSCELLINDYCNFNAARIFFDLSSDESMYLFDHHQYPEGKRNRTAKCVARRIRKFVTRKQKCLA